MNQEILKSLNLPEFALLLPFPESDSVFEKMLVGVKAMEEKDLKTGLITSLAVLAEMIQDFEKANTDDNSVTFFPMPIALIITIVNSAGILYLRDKTRGKSSNTTLGEEMLLKAFGDFSSAMVRSGNIMGNLIMGLEAEVTEDGKVILESFNRLITEFKKFSKDSKDLLELLEAGR